MSKFISLKSLPTILEPLKRLISHKAQDVDWNENDPASPGYIANRTHYKAMEKAYWWENQNVAFEQMDENVFVTSGPNPMAIAVESDEVIVILDGFEYKCRATYNEDLDIVVIGNIGPMTGTNDTGEPFCWGFYPAGEFSQFLVFVPGWEHTISIYVEGEVVHKIPEEYLPETGVGKKFTGDNGSGEIFNDYDNNFANGYAHAEGTFTTASGSNSHAEGTFTTASGHTSHSEGYETIASGYAAHTEGVSTSATGTGSHAEGVSTQASNSYAHAEGYKTQATASSAHAEGHETQATAPSAHAEGSYSYAFGNNSHAEGNSTANGAYSHAEGNSSFAYGQAAHSENNGIAIGYNSHSENDGFAFGAYSHSEGKTEPVYIKISGSANSKVYSFVCDQYKNNLLKCKFLTLYGGYNGASAGAAIESVNLDNSTITLKQTLSSSSALSSKVAYAHFEGAMGQYSHSGGINTVSGGKASTTIGIGTEVKNRSTFALGEYNLDDNEEYIEVVREGSGGAYFSNTLTYEITKVEPILQLVPSIEDVSYKSFTYQNIQYNVSVKDFQVGDYYDLRNDSYKKVTSVSVYSGTQTNIQYETYKVSWNINEKGKYILQAGNGTSNYTRSNAHTLDWSGNGWFAGGLKVGGTGQDDENAVSVLTENDLAVITESEIDAICGQII